MKLKLIIIALIAVAALSGSAVGQTDEPVDPEELNQDPEACETIDENTAICEVSLDGNTAELVIDSEINQRITLTDGMGIMEGGEINRDRRTITEGRNRVTFGVTVHRGDAAVSVDTGDVLYGQIIREQQSLLDQPVTTSDVQAGSLGGAASVAVVFLVLVYRAVRGKDEQPERVA